jgi:NPL4 family
MEGYQVSAQCMALVRDNCLLPTKDAPELGYVRESTDKQYVPDVFYKVSPTIKTFSLSLFPFIIHFFLNYILSEDSFFVISYHQRNFLWSG